MKLQGELFNTAGDFIAEVFKNSKRSRVHLARNAVQPDTGERRWVPRSGSLPKMVETANSWSFYSEDDCYWGINGYSFAPDEWQRAWSNVKQLNGFYADFDFYKIDKYKHLSAIDFASEVLNDNEWLLPPTVVIDSGKGCWMFWLFKRPPVINEKHDWMSQWQENQTFLVDQLTAYGADPACRDATRVARLPNTINSKTGRPASGMFVGQRYEFAEIKACLRKRYGTLKDQEAERKRAEYEAKGKTFKKSKAKSGKVVKPKAFNGSVYSLHRGRMNDYRKLAKLRGEKLGEHRRQLVHLYTVSAAWFCFDQESLIAEVQAFVNDCIHEPHKHLDIEKNQAEVLRRFRNHRELKNSGFDDKEIRRLLNDGSDDNYWRKTARIIQELEITQPEMRHMAITIDSEIYKKREAQRSDRNRRKNGIQTFSERQRDRQAKVAENASEALRLRLSGLTVRAIAEEMNASVGSVHNWLKKADERNLAKVEI
jgi:hypothetical protein